MSPDPTETEKFALIELLKQEIDRARFPLSPRIVTLRRILDKLDPQPEHEPLPPPRIYAPPRAKAGQRRGTGR